MKSVLVLGGAGFVGVELVAALAGRGDCEITAVDNLERGILDGAARKLFEQPGVRFLKLDLTDAAAFAGLDKDYDDIYLLAGVVGVRYTLEAPERVVRTNGLIVLNTLDWWRARGRGRLLYASTSETYAGGLEVIDGFPIPTPETVPVCISDILNPRFSYAASKQFGEAAVNAYARSLRLPAVILRYHNVYGPRMGYEHVIPELSLRLLRREEPFILYGADQTRAFCHVADAVRGTIAAMAQASSEVEIFHMGNDDEEILIADLFERLQRHAGIRPETMTLADAPKGSPARRGPDLTKARARLGYAPEVSLDVGLGLTFDWYKAAHPDGQKPEGRS